MQTHWSIDFGTTNTLIARWMGTHSEVVPLPEICTFEPSWQTPLIPTVIYFEDSERGYVGQRAHAADEVMRSTYSGQSTAYARAFKRTLARHSARTVASVGYQNISARQCTTVFLRELLKVADQTERESLLDNIPRWNIARRFVAWARREGLVNDLTMTVPVDSFEAYRMELGNIMRKLGVQRTRVLDEPVAAALGYGVDLSDERTLLVVDFGGGTLDVALVRTLAGASMDGKKASVSQRRARLMAARGMELGGETVDEWVAEFGCKHAPGADAIKGFLRQQAEAIKKDLSGKTLGSDTATFRIPGREPISMTRNDFLCVLKEKGLIEQLQRITEEVMSDAAAREPDVDIDAVLLVGGSTLLPGVRELFESMYGPEYVHYWEPFEAVVKGAAIFGAGFQVDQIVHHDYAIRVFNPDDKLTTYELLVRRGTPYPTEKAFMTRFYSVARDASRFSLPICEVGLAGRHALDWKSRHKTFYWTPASREEEDLCVSDLNEGDGMDLNPKGQADESTRIRIEFHIDAERFLCAKIFDTLTDKVIRSERVQRLR